VTPDEQNQHNERRVESQLIWEELRYIRRKLDSVEQKVLTMFGTIAAISVAIAVYEVLSRGHL